MNRTFIQVKLIDALETRAEEEGLELVTVEVKGALSRPTIVVYLDCEGGINVDQLAEANRWVEEIIEDLALFDSSYVLEVSSPGLNRPLRKITDFERFKGEEVKIKRKTGESSSQMHRGELLGVEDQFVCVRTKELEIKIPIHDIMSARLVAKINF